MSGSLGRLGPFTRFGGRCSLPTAITAPAIATSRLCHGHGDCTIPVVVTALSWVCWLWDGERCGFGYDDCAATTTVITATIVAVVIHVVVVVVVVSTSVAAIIITTESTKEPLQHICQLAVYFAWKRRAKGLEATKVSPYPIAIGDSIIATALVLAPRTAAIVIAIQPIRRSTQRLRNIRFGICDLSTQRLPAATVLVIEPEQVAQNLGNICGTKTWKWEVSGNEGPGMLGRRDFDSGC